MDEWVDDSRRKQAPPNLLDSHPRTLLAELVAVLGEGLQSPGRECSRPTVALLAP